MKKSIQLTLVMCLCFILVAQAQITKIYAYGNKLKELSTVESGKLESLFFGPISRIEIRNGEKPLFSWPEEGPVKSVDLNYDAIDQLKSPEFSNSFNSAEVISIKWEKGKPLNLYSYDLSRFKKLKYIFIKSYDDITIDELKSLIDKLFNADKISQKIEVIFYQMETPS